MGGQGENRSSNNSVWSLCVGHRVGVDEILNEYFSSIFTVAMTMEAKELRQMNCKSYID